MLIAIVILSILLVYSAVCGFLSYGAWYETDRKLRGLASIAGHYLPSDPRLLQEMEKVHGKAGIAAIRDYLERRGMMVIQEEKPCPTKN